MLALSAKKAASAFSEYAAPNKTHWWAAKKAAPAFSEYAAPYETRWRAAGWLLVGNLVG
jgi:hypothetical protein